MSAHLPGDRSVSRHFGAVLEANARTGPGRGPAPAPGPDRWWWLRWRMFDALMHDALEALDAFARARVLSRWPAGWPDADSGLLSIRQMEWVRVSLVGRHKLDVRGRLLA